MATASCVTYVGFVSAASRVPWSDTRESRRVSDWLPRIDEAPIDPKTGRFTIRWYNYFRVLGERLGGIDGPSITTINTALTDTQGVVAETVNYAAQVSDYASSIAATAGATAQVVTTNNLSGATSIPDYGDPPPKPGQQAR